MMEFIIDFNDSLSTLRIPLAVNGVEFSLTGNTMWGIVMWIGAAFLQRLSASGYGSWTEANSVIEPSLASSPPPIITALNGCFGLLLSFILWPLVVFLSISGLDQIIWQGDTFELFAQLFAQ